MLILAKGLNNVGDKKKKRFDVTHAVHFTKEITGK